MIVPMKKLTVITQSKDALSAVSSLRSLGVVHVAHQKAPVAKDISALHEDIAVLDTAFDILRSEMISGAAADETPDPSGDWKNTAKHIIDSRGRMEQLAEYSRTLKALISTWERWGDFDPETIQLLRERGVQVQLYQIPAKEVKDLPSGLIVEKIFTSQGMVFCAVISQQKIDIPFKEISIPKMSLAKMRLRLVEDQKTTAALRAEIHSRIGYLKVFTKVKKLIQKEIEFKEALHGMGEADNLSYLTGFIPYDAAKQVSSRAKEERWAVVIEDPSEDEAVPTLVRNPRWISIINPVFKLLEIVPGYTELDISFWFLVFFSIFFGMLIGDAGYGAVFLLLTIFAHKKFGKKLSDKSIFILFYILSLCAIIWGLLTGTIFGQEWLPSSFKPIVPALRNDKTIQELCFLLGATHLTIAHAWRAMLKLPRLTALADVGWISILWGGLFLAKTLVLGQTFPSFGKWLFIIGSAAVVIFTEPNKNVLKGLGAGLGNLLLNIVNSFTDIVSYIRLFAVGLATVAVADSFNKMALDIGFGNIFTSIATCLILLLGHGLNIVLGPMSVLVHGVRLNVLEFCSHVDIKWSGFAYRPLREEPVKLK